MRGIAAHVATLVWATAGSLLAQKGEVLKVGFYNSNNISADNVVFTEGVNLIPGNNASTPRLPDGVPAAKLKQPNGSPSSWGIEALSEEIGGPNAAMGASASYTADVTDSFPATTISGTTNGVPLQGATAASITLSGLRVGEVYRVTVLAGRGNPWSGGTTVYAVDGLTLSATVLAQRNAQATTTGTTVSAAAHSGNWALMAFETYANAPTLTLSANGGNGNLQAIALEGLGSSAGAIIWKTAGDGSWADPANWNGDLDNAKDLALLPNVSATSVTIEARNATTKEVHCIATETVYTLNTLPDTVAIRSSGRLVLTHAEGRYRHTIASGTVYVTGETVTFAGTHAGTLEVDCSYGNETSPRPGHLTLNGSATHVTLAEGCTLAGNGHISGTLTVAPNSQIDASQSTLTIGTLAPQTLDFEARALPVDTDGPTNHATVIVRAQRESAGYLLKWTACNDNVTFALPPNDSGTLDRRPDGLWYIPPEISGYRLRLR